LIILDGQQESPVGWTIGARKPVEFLLEALKAEVNAQIIGVFHQQVAGGMDLDTRLGGEDDHGPNAPRFSSINRT
jgi:hypothetical protein